MMMMQEQKIFKNMNLISLKNLKICLNKQNNYTYTIQSKSSALQLISQQLNLLKDDNGCQKYLLHLKLNLIQTQYLTVLNKDIQVLTIYLSNGYEIKVNLKLSKLFDLKNANYFIQIQTILTKKKKFVEQGYVRSQIHKSNFSYTHQIDIWFTSNQPFCLQKDTTSTIVLGSKNNKWDFSIQNLQLETIQNRNSLTFQSSDQKVSIQNFSLQGDYSYPLTSNLELPYQRQHLLMQIMSKLPAYESPQHNNRSNDQLFISHDMKGGYLQETLSFSPLKNSNRHHSYRYNYWQQTSTFNYFSHHTITIPPLHYRQLCYKYGVSCLGTFILQSPQQYEFEQQFFNEQFALKLVYLAKKIKFDGYLINIEVNISNIANLIKWLRFLTQTINQHIPNSQIIWYDSIIRTGQVNYQNELNYNNQVFYQSTNGMFLNYWWNQQKLKKSLQIKLPHKSIFVGNDCFGRNTFAGGKYDIYKAISMIQSIPQLSIALFAPGFTYQDNGQNSRENFIQNQLKLYHGSNISLKQLKKWKVTLNGGQGWNMTQDWAITSYQLCRRQALVSLKQYQGMNQEMVIRFQGIVGGTGPKFNDYYKIVLQVLDIANNMVFIQKQYHRNVATQAQQTVQIVIQIDCGLISHNTCIKLIQQGKDVQHWAGHFGARFKNQSISIKLENQSKNWIKSIPIRPIQLSKCYTTYFNKGQGSNFYYNGNKMQSSYCSLQDYDIGPIFSLNKYSNIQIFYKDSFIGGSCLKFKNTKSLIINTFIISQEQKVQTVTLLIQVVTKGTNPINVLVNETKFNFQSNKSSIVDNQWVKNCVQIVLNINIQRSFHFGIQFQKDSGFIGQFKMSKQLTQTKSYQGQINISFNNKVKFIRPYSIDLYIQVKHLSQNQENSNNNQLRYLIKIADWTSFINLTKIQQKIVNKVQNLIKQQNKVQNLIKQDNKVQQLIRQYNKIQQSKRQNYYKGLIKNLSVMSQQSDEFNICIIDLLRNKQILKKLISKQSLFKLIQTNSLRINFSYSQ